MRRCATFPLLLLACTGPEGLEGADDTAAGALGGPAEGLVLNEVMTDNDSSVSHDPGDFQDYVELFHGGDGAVDLSLVTLDDGADPWQGSGTLAPGGHLLLWADDLPFGLSKSGDTLVLRHDGVELDRLVIGALDTDIARLRTPSGGDWVTSHAASPGWTNGVVSDGATDARGALFGEAVVNELRLTLPTSSVEALTANPYTEVSASLVAGLAVFPQIHARLKGGVGSFRELDEKAGFRLDLGDFESWTWRGLEVLTLNNAVQDPTYTHEFLSYRLFRAMGVAAPEIGWVELYVNQQHKGLYLLVETMDDRFLERWYDDPSGPYYEGGGGIDFVDYEIDDMEHDGGEDDRSQLYALADLIEQVGDGAFEGDAAATLDELVDLEQVAAFFAVEALIDNWDGYRSPNNYRIYVHPTEGIQLLPWGCDQTFEDTYSAVEAGDGVLFQFCLADTACLELFQSALLEASALVTDLELEAQLERLDAALDPRIAADPLLEHGDDVVKAQRAITAEVLATRPEEMAAWASGS